MKKTIKAAQDFTITSRKGLGHDESLLYDIDFEICWTNVPVLSAPLIQLKDCYGKFAISKILFVVDNINIHYQMYDGEDLPQAADGTTTIVKENKDCVNIDTF